MIAEHDTDVLVLLLAHFHKMPSDKVWLKAGSAAHRKYIPIHTIVERLHFDNEKMESITAFHAITGSDKLHTSTGTERKLAGKCIKNTLAFFKV